MTAGTRSWPAVLDELEADVDRCEAQLDAGGSPGVAEPMHWTPPEGLGTLPEPLVDRATALSWRIVAVEQRVRQRREAMRSELDDLGRRRGAGAAYAASGSTTASGPRAG